MTPLALIGCGNMGSALVRGWLSLEDHKYSIRVIKPTPEFIDPIVQQSVDWHDQFQALYNYTGVIILAVKPALIRRAIADLKPYLKPGQSIISMAAGITIAQYKQLLPDNPVTRIMPSLPAAQCQSLTPVYGEDIELAQTLFDPLGGTIVLENDKAMDVATIILGCGPGYMAFYLQAIQDGALALGLDKKSAYQFTRAMSKASINWLGQKSDFEEAITSLGREGSMTAAAIRTLREQKTPQMIQIAMEAALRQAEAISKNY